MKADETKGDDFTKYWGCLLLTVVGVVGLLCFTAYQIATLFAAK